MRPICTVSPKGPGKCFMIAVLAYLTFALETTKKEMAMLSYPVS